MTLAVNVHKSHRAREQAEKCYEELTAAGVEVLMDDQPQRPGVMFADAELIGIPYQLVIGERGLGKGIVEYRRRGGESSEIEIDQVIGFIRSNLD